MYCLTSISIFYCYIHVFLKLLFFGQRKIVYYVYSKKPLAVVAEVCLLRFWYFNAGLHQFVEGGASREVS